MRQISLSPAEWVVLVVDDYQDNLNVVVTVLEYHKSTVHTALNGKIGLEMIKTVQPNLILLDIAMPVMDGWAMYEQVRANAEWAEIPIIAITAHAMDRERQRALEVGFDGYVVKPFSVIDLIPTIQKILWGVNNQRTNNNE